MAIKTITIDFWNTIYDSSNGQERNKYRQRILVDNIDHFGIHIMGDKIQEATEATWKFFEEHWVKKHRTPNSRECVEFIWNYLNLPHEEEPVSNVVTAFEDSVLKYPPKILPDAKIALEKLAEEYPLAIISDTGFSPGIILKQLMDNDDVTKYFKAFSFSNETGFSKPNPKAFQAALSPLKGLPKESIHIGDIEETDVAGARGLGMRSIRYTGSVTKYLGPRNTDDTKADFMLDSWDEIIETIEKLK